MFPFKVDDPTPRQHTWTFHRLSQNPQKQFQHFQDPDANLRMGHVCCRIFAVIHCTCSSALAPSEDPEANLRMGHVCCCIFAVIHFSCSSALAPSEVDYAVSKVIHWLSFKVFKTAKSVAASNHLQAFAPLIS